MADETLVVGSQFDPSGFLKGIDTSVAAFESLEGVIQGLANAFPDLSSADFLEAISLGAADAARDLKVTESAVKSLTSSTQVLASQPIITRDKVAELRLLSGQLIQSGADAVRFTKQVDGMNLSLLASSGFRHQRWASDRPGGQGAGGSSSWDRGLAGIGGAQAAESLAKSSRAANMMRSSLVTLAAQSVQTSSAVGQLAQSALFFAGGATGVIAVAAAVLAAAKAYEVLTAKTRQAQQAHDDLVSSFNKRVEAETAALGGDSSGRGQARAELQTLDVQQRQLRVQEALARSSFDLIGAAIFRSRIEKNIADQARITLNLKLDEGRAERAMQEAAQAPGRDLISGLGEELATLQLGEDAVRRLTVANAAHSDSERTAALAILAKIQAIEAHNRAVKDAEAAAKDLAAATKVTEKAYDDLSKTLLGEMKDGWKESKKAADDYVQAVQDGIDGLLTAEEIHLEFINKQMDAYNQVADAIFGVALAAGDIGLITRELTNAIGAALDLVGALKKISLTSASLVNILGAIAPALGIIGAIGGMLGIGGGPSRTELLLATNNDRLADLKASLDDSIATLDGLNASREQLAAIGDLPHRIGPKGMDLGIDQAALEKQLRDSGMSLAEWAARIRQQTGLEVLDDKGRLVASTLEQVDIALKLLAERAAEDEAGKAARDAERAAEEAAQALEDAARAAREAAAAMIAWKEAAVQQAQTLLDLRAALAGEGQDAIGQFTRNLLALSAGFPDFTAKLGPMNLDDPGTREALRAQLLSWMDQITAGTLTAEDLGLTQDAFLQFIQNATTFLDSFNESLDGATGAIDAATKSLTNVPVGYSLALRQFQASMAGIGNAPGSTAPPPSPRGRELGDALPFRPRGGDGASLPVTAQHFNGPMTIIVEGGTSVAPEEAARRIKAAFKRDQMATSGRPDLRR